MRKIRMGHNNLITVLRSLVGSSWSGSPIFHLIGANTWKDLQRKSIKPILLCVSFFSLVWKQTKKKKQRKKVFGRQIHLCHLVNHRQNTTYFRLLQGIEASKREGESMNEVCLLITLLKNWWRRHDEAQQFISHDISFWWIECFEINFWICDFGCAY